MPRPDSPFSPQPYERDAVYPEHLPSPDEVRVRVEQNDGTVIDVGPPTVESFDVRPPRYVLLAWLRDRAPSGFAAATGGASVWTAIAWSDDGDRIQFLAEQTNPDAHAVVVDTQEGK